jgi:hypothetical protein
MTSGDHRPPPPHGAFLPRLNDRIRQLVEPAEIESQACGALGQQLGADRAYYAEFDSELREAHVKREYLRGELRSLVGIYRLSDFAWCLPPGPTD